MSHSQLDAVKSMYDERSEMYDQNRVHVKQARDYVDWAQLKLGESLLDLACGTGLVALGAKSAVGPAGQVIGVDISEGMLKVARRKADDADVEVLFLNHDITDLQSLDLVASGSTGFDVITCASALILLPDPVSAVKHWKALLRLGGRLVTDVQTKDANIVMNVFGAIAPHVGVTLPWDAQRWQSLETLESVVADAGLEVQRSFETESYANTPFVRHQAREVFDLAVSKPMFKDFGQASVYEKARDSFEAEFTKCLGPSGSVVEECRYWVVVARRPA